MPADVLAGVLIVLGLVMVIMGWTGSYTQLSQFGLALPGMDKQGAGKVGS